jgi:hypothetical protein
MAQDRPHEFSQADGEILRPALGKLWGMLIVFLLMIPAAALMAYCWWFQVELPGGKTLSNKAGIVSLLAIPLALLLVLVPVALIASAKQLVIAANCVQLLSRGRVVVHIPYENVAETYAKGQGSAGVVGLRLRNRDDPATLVPSWTRDRYEIQVLTYGKPLESVHKAVSQRFSKFSTSRR